MIHYTPLSEMDIFPIDQNTFANRESVIHQGRQCYAEKKVDGSYEMLQLLSTDPNDFLNDAFQPGTIINKS